MSLTYKDLKLNDLLESRHYIFKVTKIGEEYINLEIVKCKTDLLKIGDVLPMTKVGIDFLQLTRVYCNNYKRGKYVLSFKK